MKHPLESLLESLKKPDVSASLHESALKRGLLASKKAKSFFIPMNLFKLLPAGAAVALVMALLLQTPSGTSIDSFVTPKASAQELVNQVLENVKNLSDEDLAAIQENGSLPSDQMMQILADAVTAPDLDYMEYETITCAEAAEALANGMPAVATMRFTFPASHLENSDEFILGDEEGCTSAYTVHARPDARFPNGFSEVHSFEGDYVEAPLTYLEYTKSNGDHVYVGLSEDLAPVYAGNISQMLFGPGFDFTGDGWMNMSDDGEGGLTIQTNGDAHFSVSSTPGEFTVTANDGSDVTAGGGEASTEIYFSETNHSEPSEEALQELTVDENGCSSWTSEDGQMGGGGC